MLSIADYVGAGFYVLTMALSLAACTSVPSGSRWARERRHWLLLAMFMAMLTVVRLLQVEELARDALRAFLRTGHEYDKRAALQVPVAVALMLLGGVAAAWFAWTWPRRPPARSISAGAAIAMLGLYAIRIVSLHNVDRLLYASIGPFRLNYAFELAILGAIWWACLVPLHARALAD